MALRVQNSFVPPKRLIQSRFIPVWLIAMNVFLPEHQTIISSTPCVGHRRGQADVEQGSASSLTVYGA